MFRVLRRKWLRALLLTAALLAAPAALVADGGLGASGVANSGELARAVCALQTEHGHRPAAELVAPVPVLAGNGVLDAQIGLALLVEEDRRAAVEQAQYVGHVLHKARFRGKNADGHNW